MSPTLQNGDIVFVQKWVTTFSPGDIVVFSAPRVNGEKRIKRIVAGENSEIYMDDFKLFVNGKSYVESSDSPPTWNKVNFLCRVSPLRHTSAEEYFVLGDNRCESYDSLDHGPIHRSDILGTAKFVVFRRKWNPFLSY